MFLFVRYRIKMDWEAPLVGIRSFNIEINETFFGSFCLPFQAFLYFFHSILVSLIQNVFWFEKVIYFLSLSALVRVKVFLKVFKLMSIVFESVKDVGVVSFGLVDNRTFG